MFFWTLISMMVIAPAFQRSSRGDYIFIGVIAVIIWVVQRSFLFTDKEMSLAEASVRGFATGLISIATGYLFAHFCLHKRPFRDLFRRH